MNNTEYWEDQRYDDMEFLFKQENENEKNTKLKIKNESKRQNRLNNQARKEYDRP